MKAHINFSFHNNQLIIKCTEQWNVFRVANAVNAIDVFKKTNLPRNCRQAIIFGEEIDDLDSAGAISLLTLENFLKALNYVIKYENFHKTHLDLINLIKNQDLLSNKKPEVVPKLNLFEMIGYEAKQKLYQAKGFFGLVGTITKDCFDFIKNPKKFHFNYVVSNIYSAGIKALPIIGLLSFLIGIVLAYQMGLQLQTYGANILIAFLSGMAIFREFAPLITAIIVAGRTGSSFTAQIGSMKVNEEIDAINTMGLSPTKLLVIPKLLGLLIVFPLLIFWANIFSILGAMFMSKTMLNVGYIDFLMRLKSSVGLKQLLLGLYKAPAFSLIIALVGCFQGFAVEASGEKNIGFQTTKSVVQALFLIIIADAAFSVLYSWMGL